MHIAGFLKNSFVDYPGNISCVVFTPGCNMNCWYCHNSHLLTAHKNICESEIFDFLKERKGFIDGVVISGGEPTLQPDLFEFIRKIKNMGYKVKLDTNGTNYEIVKKLINENLMDFVAMDIKAPFSAYKKITGTDDDMLSIEATKNLLINRNVDYELRTTYSPDLTLADIETIAKSIIGAKKFVIQKYNLPANNRVVMLERSADDYKKALITAKNYVENSVLRGI